MILQVSSLSLLGFHRWRTFWRTFTRVTYACALMFVLASCNSITGEDAVSKDLPFSSTTDSPEDFDRRTALGRNSEPSVITLSIGDALKEHLASEDDDLPANVMIQNTNLNGVPVAAALQAVLGDTNISLTWQAGDFDDRLVTILNLSGPLPSVVERICSAARIYCSYRNGTLELLEKETFIIEMPPIPSDAENTIATTIGTLASADGGSSSSSSSGGGGGSGSVTVDKDGGNLIYTADTAGQARVKQYLSQLRRGRPLIMMQLYIWEVQLDDNSEAGISWTQGKLGTISELGQDVQVSAGIPGSAGTNAISFGAVFSGLIDANVVASFLRTKGNVETVSNPQMTFVSGSESEFSIGGKQTYISGVGQLVGSTASSSATSSSGLSTNTVQTSSVDTGINVKMSGSYEGGVIFGQLEMKDTNLVSLKEISSSGTTIQLPVTQDRELKTVLRLRPGDTMLLAGLRSQTNNIDRNEILGLGLPTSAKNNTAQREMVIMLRPSIIRFTDQTVEHSAFPSKNEVPNPAAPEVLRAKTTVESAPISTIIPSSLPVPSPVPPAPIEPPAATISTDSLQRTFNDVKHGRRAR